MMDAVKYLKAMDRMCKSHETCGECGLAFGKEEGCGRYVFDHPAEAVRIVEEWSKAHPIQTNADKFKEVFGFEPYADMAWAAANDEYAAELHDTAWWDMPYEAPKGE